MSKKKKPYIPKIVVCPSDDHIQDTITELLSILGNKAMGICVFGLADAISLGLPLKEAKKFDEDKKPHDVYLTYGVVIPDSYEDPRIPVNIASIQKAEVRKEKLKLNKPQPKSQKRNDLCECGSGLKFKNCCMNIN